jgi:hypothetical protein
MPVLTLLRRLLHTETETPPEPERLVTPDDRSELLRELEVAVPAPERIVGWDAARGAQRFSRT